MTVYFIRAGESGPVKIGHTNNPYRRRDNLQTASNETLHIIRLIEGGRDLERHLHHVFAPQKIRREWFTFVPEMMGDFAATDLPVDRLSDLSTKRPSVRLERKLAAGCCPALVRAIERVGQKELAKHIGTSPAAVSQWRQCPINRVLAVEALTGIPRHELRPDIYPPVAA